MTAKSDLVSIAISIHQQPTAWVVQCLSSCLGQSHPSIEVLVRIDGPEGADSSVICMLEAWQRQDPRLRWWQGQRRRGTFGSYRCLMAASRGSFLAQVDADDWLAPNAIARCLEVFADHPAAGMVYSRFCAVDAEGKPLHPAPPTRPHHSQFGLLAGLMTFHLRLLRRSAYELVGGYRPIHELAGDYDLCLRVSELFEVAHVAEPLYFYRVHGSNTFRRRSQALVQEGASAVAAAIARREGHGHIHLRVARTTGRHQLKPCGVSLPPSPSLDPAPGHAGVVVTGMHRSRTSLVAKELVDAGFRMGEDLLAADRNNPWGYFEDLDFLRLACSVLTGDPQLAWPCRWQPLGTDWLRSAGLAASTEVIERFPASSGAVEMAGALYRRKAFLAMAAGRPWGWKDPRAALMLKAWKRLAPDLKVVAVIRPLMDVLASLKRWDHPDYRNRDRQFSNLWMLYNKAILRFYACFPHDVILLNSDRCLREGPGQLVSKLQAQWGSLPTCSPRQVYSELLATQTSGSRLLQWIDNARTPEALELVANHLIEPKKLHEVDF